MKNWIKAVIAVLIPLLTGGISGYFTATSVGTWYTQINKPTWNPPNQIFAPVWTILYIMMGIALFLIWKSNANAADKKKAIIIWSMQMLLNFLWSFIFFNQHLIGLALADIAGMWFFILITIFAFAKINKTAAWLLVPYIAWVSFAGVLNFAIWWLN